MKATFDVSNESYCAEIHRGERPEGEKFEIFEVTVRGPDQGVTQGFLKLTEEALDVAARKASDQGGSNEDWLARGCGRALAAELVIRKLKPDFSFVVDYRWI